MCVKLTTGEKYSEKKRKHICVAVYCRHKAKDRRLLCNKHRRQDNKFKNPLGYWYAVHRDNAKRRKIEFSITLDEFRVFCNETKYLEKKARFPGLYTIDRKKSYIGYTLENMQLLMLAVNSRKRFVDLKIQFGYYPTNEEIEAMFEGDRNNVPEPKIEYDDLPF